MNNELQERSGGLCEICNSGDSINEFLVPPKTEESASNMIALCSKCLAQITESEQLDIEHLRCLNDAIWNPTPPVQVVTYRLLSKLSTEPWAVDLKSQIYMDDETLEWARQTESNLIHLDSNGHPLSNGDSVVLIQDLNVKGANFTAKRGTAVRRIRLVHDNDQHIEGKVNGQQIVILTKYVKKS